MKCRFLNKKTALIGTIILAAVILAFLFWPRNYSAHITGQGLGSDANLTTEKDYWKNWSEDENKFVPKQTVTVQGDSIDITYSYTLGSNSFAKHYDYYGVGDTHDSYIFERESDKLVGFINHHTQAEILEEARKPDVDDPKQHAIQVAKEYAGDYVNINEFEMTVTEHDPQTAVENGNTYSYGLYSIIFRRHIAGIATEEHIMVNVTSKGTITNAQRYEIGLFDSLKLTGVEVAHVRAAMDAKIKSIYANDTSFKSYKADYERIQCTPDDGYIFKGFYIAELVDENGNKSSAGIALSVEL